ncbi:hypothetical protein [Comamonas thiooxydans]|uniref:Uncharacterized protein n=1 Tax=Comamonas thiooxydans TaxID=363952 RepID=A0A0E3BRQ5_9BURK|nr:hypothetical protein [Comamonas thiooxydans]KGH09813.1 hypothetical protein P608_16325 [Comamonas thiooxydans]KGH17276.1 hypothetical protein P607_17695 [Comamonas thiooxydans]KGH19816.1 hypothetical protein P606_22185 [Comamonas thiooxydans]
MRQVALFIAMAWIGCAHAIQPVEAGLQPLLDRQKGMLHEQPQLNKLLQSTITEPKVRADAYREYLMVELERQELECDIQGARSWASSPLVTYARPMTETTCGAGLAYRSGKSSLSTSEAKR